MTALPRTDLARDAAALYQVATGFIRIYQFRDRDTALRFGLTVVQAYTLDILVSSGGRSLTALAAALKLDKSTASRVVSGMTKHGLVEWSRPADDGRGKWIVASREGKHRYARLRRALVKDNERLLATYSRSARKSAIAVLTELVQRAAGERDSSAG